MIGKLLKSKSFSAPVQYVMDKPEAVVIRQNVAGLSSNVVAEEFRWELSLRPTIKHPCQHAILSVKPGEKVNESQWRDIAVDYLQQMGFGHSRFIAVRHHDTDHDHIHIVCSRIDRSGKLISDSWDRRRSEHILRGIEQAHGLSPTLRPAQVIQSNASKKQEENKEAIASIKGKVDRAIDSLSANNRSVMLLVERLAVEELRVMWRIRNRKLTGLSFEYEGQAIAGSVLGKEYSWQGLQKYKGVTIAPGDEQSIISQQPPAPVKQRKTRRSPVEQKRKLRFDWEDIAAAKEELSALWEVSPESLMDVQEVSGSLEEELEDIARWEAAQTEGAEDFELVLDKSAQGEGDRSVYIFDLNAGEFRSYAGTTKNPRDIAIFSSVAAAKESLPDRGRFAIVATTAKAIEAEDLNPDALEQVHTHVRRQTAAGGSLEIDKYQFEQEGSQMVIKEQGEAIAWLEEGELKEANLSLVTILHIQDLVTYELEIE